MALVEPEGRRLTWAQLDAEVDAVAQGLNASGLVAGYRVVLALTNRIEFVTCYLGALRARLVVSLLVASVGVWGCAASRATPMPAAERATASTGAARSQVGLASWYGTFHHGLRTASGENEAGGSIRASASTWSTWFCRMSRVAPACS